MAKFSTKYTFMRKWDLLEVIMIFVFCAGLSGCAEHDLNNAKRLNTVTAYNNFMEKYPHYRYHALLREARKLREPLLWEEAKKENTIASFDNYLEEYRTGKFALEAKQRKELLVCEYVKQKNTLEDYFSYLKLYPEGKCAPEEIRLIVQLSSPSEEKRNEAVDLLSKLGEELTQAVIEEIIKIMRHGIESWSKRLYRSGHCTWYEKTTVKKYAAKSLVNMKSQYVTNEIVKEARNEANKEKTKYRITDPGWICY
ncbi:MAG: hypothetical protein FVQ80_02960 [Planctomycetes bacterium]|nr:hypothetical protein [Planctomycetota bacterium]